MLGSLLRIAVKTAVLPLAIVKDAVTILDPDEPSETPKVLGSIAEDLDEIL